VQLTGQYGADYATRAGDDLALYVEEGIAHPAVWPALANAVFAAELVRGSWIHTRSIIRHHAAVAAGALVDVHATVVDRFERRGRWAVADIVFEVGGRTVATVEHEAIVELTPTG
jgi:acyl dehydratase